MRDEATARLAVLAGALRRRMYDFVRERRTPVSRDEAAGAVGISRKLAAFHLDKLEEAGFLKSHYARPSGRGGPGAGRPSKLYESTDVEVQVSVPQRHYDIPGEILLEALETHLPDEDPQAAAERIAYERGFELGRQNAGGSLGTRPNGRTALRSAETVLRDYGFEPYVDANGTVRLRNCPFHRLAQRSPTLVCGMNRAFVDGLLRGLGDDATEAQLAPRPGECCVALRRQYP